MKSSDNSKFDAASRLAYDKRPRLAGAGRTLAVAEMICELDEIPEGTLYAALMDRMDLDTFARLIDSLVSAGLVKRAASNSNLLRWTGPAIA